MGPPGRGMMRRIFWDTMLLIYLLEGEPQYKKRTKEMLLNSYTRGDRLLTSCLSIGEVMVGGFRNGETDPAVLKQDLEQLGFEYLPFDAGAIDIFGHLRSQKIKIADAINLACAGSAGVDLFLTGDRKLWKATVPGIQFIGDFQSIN